MRKKKLLPLICSLFLFLLSACSAGNKMTQPGNKDQIRKVDQYFADAVVQYAVLAANLPPDKFPKNWSPATGKYEFSNSGWWCSGFYPGTLLYLYRETGNPWLFKEANRMLGLLEKEKNNTSTHDLGFMMYCSFGNEYKQHPEPGYKEILLTSARSLATRFNPKVGCIKSWDAKPSDFIVIIDNMMNLELLFWATRVSGDSSFYKIAVTHAETTMKNHFRSDYSSYHVINYDPETGAVKQKYTAQGAADESAWARGQAWGLYGFTSLYNETKDARYLQQAQHIAGFILHHPNLPADKIPYWDFNAPGIPAVLRDASAASIMASALFKLSRFVGKDEAATYTSTAKSILETLSSPAYKAKTGTNGGFLLMHSVGHRPAGTEIDVSLTYADYYYIEALTEYKKLLFEK